MERDWSFCFDTSVDLKFISDEKIHRKMSMMDMMIHLP